MTYPAERNSFIPKINILFFILIGVIGACKSNKCSSNVEVIYNKEKSKFQVHLEKSKKIALLKDNGIKEGSIGGEYAFYESGKIKHYMFFTVKGIYSYAEYFNKDGVLDSIEGNPILISNVDEINRDSIKYNFYISNLAKEIKSFSINVNNSHWITLAGNKDSVFSNVVRYEFPFNTKKTESIKILEKLSYVRCDGRQVESVDSTFIRRKQ